MLSCCSVCNHGTQKFFTESILKFDEFWGFSRYNRNKMYVSLKKSFEC